MWVRKARSFALLWCSWQLFALLFGSLAFADDKPSPDSARPVCIKCHRTETERYLSTAMGQSFIKPQKYPDAVVKHQRSGSTISVTFENGDMLHTLTEHGVTVKYPIPYQVGGGMLGSTFLVQLGGYLFESPLSWFKGYGWDVSPGYESKEILEFDRPVGTECLFCHATGARFDDPDGRRLVSKSPKSITCERCHGAIEEHLQHPSKSNVVNPSRLAGPARDSICEQCHLEGVTRVLNPGKDWSDFRPGEPAEDTFTTYVLVDGKNQGKVALASEVEQFAQSRCSQMSKGKFWCGSCHNPHADHSSRAAEIRSVCTSCHQKLSSPVHTASVTECTSCHMPSTNQTAISHASHTDHRILRQPRPVADASQPPTLVTWREPVEGLRSRNLGIAELRLPSDDYADLWNAGAALLSSLGPGAIQGDGDVVLSLEAFYLGQGDLPHALEFGRRSVELNPQSARAALGFARILQASGDNVQAEQQFLRTISLNPSWKEPYGRLVMFYAQQRRFDEARKILDRYLQWNPNEIIFRDWKKQLPPE